MLFHGFCQFMSLKNPWSEVKQKPYIGWPATSSLEAWLPDVQTKNHSLGKFLRVLQWKIYIFVDIPILWPFGTLYGQLVQVLYGHLVYFLVIWYISWLFGVFLGYLVYFFPVLVFCSKKNLATLFWVQTLNSLMHKTKVGYVLLSCKIIESLFFNNHFFAPWSSSLPSEQKIVGSSLAGV
jgi:hypothetical protein